ncbi:LysR family transcriptional regulator [Vitiosangium sp. GDMCC 1.1324]|uniref:LysR family transcriptional regulator n=1 Tax=Vitiosangium sp. (strain GDMCC 1.1324) TaxID=2138576 RepID=UPI00130EBB27|nr:LysR family transcriptional regulator [Vitiosangium sp. GDMCC 1.1324]
MAKAMDLLSQMATFVRGVESGSLSAAAREQRISLAAVSRQISALEQDLGATLLLRSSRRLSVTDAGRRWYERAVGILREVDDARASVREGAEVHGALVMSASVTMASTLLVPRLPTLLRRHPRLLIDLRIEDRLIDLVSDGVDLAIRGGAPPPDSTTLVAQPLFRFRRLVMASPAYLRERGIPRDPSDLVRHDCLVVAPGSSVPLRWVLVRGAEERAVEVRGPLRTTTPLLLRDLARGGAGIAMLPSWLVAADCESGLLRRVLPEWESPPTALWAMYSTRLRGSPRIRAFLDGLDTLEEP